MGSNRSSSTEIPVHINDNDENVPISPTIRRPMTPIMFEHRRLHHAHVGRSRVHLTSSTNSTLGRYTTLQNLTNEVADTEPSFQQYLGYHGIIRPRPVYPIRVYDTNRLRFDVPNAVGRPRASSTPRLTSDMFPGYIWSNNPSSSTINNANSHGFNTIRRCLSSSSIMTGRQMSSSGLVRYPLSHGFNTRQHLADINDSPQNLNIEPPKVSRRNEGVSDTQLSFHECTHTRHHRLITRMPVYPSRGINRNNRLRFAAPNAVGRARASSVPRVTSDMFPRYICSNNPSSSSSSINYANSSQNQLRSFELFPCYNSNIEPRILDPELNTVSRCRSSSSNMTATAQQISLSHMEQNPITTSLSRRFGNPQASTNDYLPNLPIETPGNVNEIFDNIERTERRLSSPFVTPTGSSLLLRNLNDLILSINVTPENHVSQNERIIHLYRYAGGNIAIIILHSSINSYI